MYDVAVIGAGIVGAMTARELSKYKLNICILEKENDVAMGSTRANSAIVHAGFDAEEGSLKARLNVRGSKMMKKITDELGVKYVNNGSLVIGFSDEDKEHLRLLYKRGIANGVEGPELIDAGRLRELEPNISENAVCALYAPTGAIVCPYELCIAAVGNAMDNGAKLELGFDVQSISENDGVYTIVSADGRKMQSRYVINAAGIYSDAIAKLIGDTSFEITPRRGEYILLDKECGTAVSHTIFRTPGKMGKGILISPTVDGNLLTGPTSVNITDKEDRSTTPEGFAHIIKEANENVNGVQFGKAITSFCGLRSVGSTGDFIITSPKKGFVNAAGIESPGLSASPAIAEYIKELLSSMGLALDKNDAFSPYRKPLHFFREMSVEEKNRLIKEDKRYGHIICRCENVTEGEIVYAMEQNPKPTDLDGIKRRTRAQMGRCQGGFCSPYIVELISEKLGIPYEQVTKQGGNSYVNVSKTKEEKQ